MEAEHAVSASSFFHCCRSTPFEGQTPRIVPVRGQIVPRALRMPGAGAADPRLRT